MTQFREMTHKELMALTETEREAYSHAKNEDFHNKVKIEIEKGFTHIQLQHGCIKVRKSKNGIVYSLRSGKGFGADLSQDFDLRDCTRSLMGCGWGDIKSCK
jgi:hypothetical protein